MGLRLHPVTSLAPNTFEPDRFNRNYTRRNMRLKQI